MSFCRMLKYRILMGGVDALSRRKQGFNSPWDYQKKNKGLGIFSGPFSFMTILPQHYPRHAGKNSPGFLPRSQGLSGDNRRSAGIRNGIKWTSAPHTTSCGHDFLDMQVRSFYTPPLKSNALSKNIKQKRRRTITLKAQYEHERR
jgi:hypothetical protein